MATPKDPAATQDEKLKLIAGPDNLSWAHDNVLTVLSQFAVSALMQGATGNSLSQDKLQNTKLPKPDVYLHLIIVASNSMHCFLLAFTSQKGRIA